MKIYLAGTVPKGAQEEKEWKNWRLEYKAVLDKFLQADYIFPNAGQMDENDFLLIVGKDSKSIKICDLVIVNAEEKLGAGTSLEMAIAKYFKKPVVSVIPKNSHHRRSNVLFDGKYLVADWINPFIATFSDFIVEHPQEIEAIKNKIFAVPPKDLSIIDQAIAHRDEVHPES